MMIYMLAAAMTIAMLIATAFGIHQEAAARPRQRQPERMVVASACAASL